MSNSHHLHPKLSIADRSADARKQPPSASMGTARQQRKEPSGPGAALRNAAVLFGVLALALTACGLRISAPPAPPPPPTSLVPEHPTEFAPCPERVLIMSADGMRPDALSPERAPNIYTLAAGGAYTWKARTVRPPSTLPAHTSMLTGYDVPQHGISWNDYFPEMGYIHTTSLFAIAHEHGLRTSMFIAKEKMQHIASPGTVDDFVLLDGPYGVLSQEAVRYINQDFGVMFVHLRRLDKAGHTYGWMSPEYISKVPEIDADVGMLLDALRQAGLAETTLLIFTADHGGHGTNHMTGLGVDMNIPWIVYGPGVEPGTALTSSVKVYDTAATSIWGLGFPLPSDMKGQPVLEAFRSGMEVECELAGTQSLEWTPADLLVAGYLGMDS